MNLSEAYRLFGEDSEEGSLARQMLDQQHWFTSVAEFDPRTGDALPLGLDIVLHRLANRDETTNLRDRLWRLVEHSRAPVERLLGSLSEDPRREQAVLPIRAVKELNATSFIALSRRPGRNVREKLAGKPYMQAVRRYQSVDLPQNRLLKEFATQMADLLEMRQRYLGEDEDALIRDIHRWLRSDAAQAISRWDNLPPNNSLLSHRDYQRVWDSWGWLQSLDEDMDRDFDQIEARAATVDRWEGLGKAYSEGMTLFGDMPVLFDYDTFTIEPWRGLLTRGTTSANRQLGERAAVINPACVDLAYVRPRYASSGDVVSRNLAEAFLWQHWENDRAAVDLELFDSDAVVLHQDATTLTSADLFLARGAGGRLLQSAAHSFARKLSSVFVSPDLVWLIPDALNDFELQVARRNINARFAHAEPLPRSVAAVFEHVDHSRIPGSGYRAVIVDSFDGKTYATKLITGHDSELERRIPATRGFYWERTPHVKINDIDGFSGPSNEIPYFDGHDEWFEAVSTPELTPVSEGDLRAHPQIGDFDICVTLAGSPVVGGMRLHDLQLQAGGIPLWRDHIPELSIKVIKDGRRQAFYLVSSNTTIRPVRGTAVQIDVPESFTLAANTSHYEFPLFQGDATSDLGYQAILKSPGFPLHADAVCTLDLTYTYGADDPYRLRFVPVDKSFPPVTATWHPMSERQPVDLDALPVPPFPQPSSWDAFEHWPRPQPDPITGATRSDLLEWIGTALAYLNPEAQLAQAEEQANKRVLNQLRRVLDERVEGSFRFGKYDRNDRYFCFVDIGGEDIFCHESHFVEFVTDGTLSSGDSVYLSVDRSRGKPSGRFISHSAWNPPALEEALRAARRRPTEAPEFDYVRAQTKLFTARFPTYTVWRHGRSIQDEQCPGSFRRAVVTGIADATRLLNDEMAPKDLKDELFFLLCRMHADAPEFVQQHLLQLVRGRNLERSMEAPIAYALGTCSETWQQTILERVLAGRFKGRHWILSVALWRSSEPIAHLSTQQVASLLPQLSSDLAADAESGVRSDSVRRITIVLELLLALLRTRESTDPEMKRLLSPDSEYGRLFTELIDRITDKAAEAGVDIPSRVEILVDKPQEFARIPDLLYALRLYLTGDDGALAVRITGVADE